jgi:hypothetical protein
VTDLPAPRAIATSRTTVPGQSGCLWEAWFAGETRYGRDSVCGYGSTKKEAIANLKVEDGAEARAGRAVGWAGHDAKVAAKAAEYAAAARANGQPVEEPLPVGEVKFACSLVVPGCRPQWEAWLVDEGPDEPDSLRGHGWTMADALADLEAQALNAEATRGLRACYHGPRDAAPTRCSTERTSMNLARGLVRLWLVPSGLWVLMIGWMMWPRGYTLSWLLEFGFTDFNGPSTTEALLDWAYLMLLPPAFVFVLGAGLVWAVRGFHGTPSVK